MDKNSDINEAELKGELKGKKEAARNAVKKGFSSEYIAKITGLPLETVLKLKVELSNWVQDPKDSNVPKRKMSLR